MMRPWVKAGACRALTLVCWYVAACSSDKAAPSSQGVPAAGVSGSSAAAVGGSGARGPLAGQSGPAGLAGNGAVAGSSSAGATGVIGAAGSSGGLPAAAGAGGTVPVVDPAAAVLEYHKNPARDGNYADAAFTRAAAATLKKDATFSATFAGPNYAQPLYFVGGPGGVDLLITATEQNEVSAFSALDGSVVWRKTLAPPATTGLPCGNIKPLGVTGTPVIDAASRTLFVAAMTSGPKHQIFALSVDDGSARAGWPVDVDTVKAGSRAFSSAVHNQRGALLIVNQTVYVPYGGHFGDCGDYHGWVVGVPLDKPNAPFAFATAAHAGGIWAPGGLASDGSSVFAATGNTMSDSGGLGSSPTTWGHGNAILRLAPDLKNIEQSQTKDFFAAQDWSALDNRDYDVGGSGPILFSVPGATPSELVMALGKGGDAYLIGRDSLGGMGGELSMKSVSAGGVGGGMIQAAAAYTTATGTFVVFRSVQSVMGCGSGSGNLGAIKVEKGAPPTMSVAWCAGGPGTGSPIVTTRDGSAESVVWYTATGKLYGFNGETGMPVYTSESLGTVNKFQTPIVAKGRLFIATSDQLVALKP